MSHTVRDRSYPDSVPPEASAQFERLYAGTANPLKARSHAAIARFFDGLALVEPGLVPVPLWHPDEGDWSFRDDPARSLLLAGVGRKP